MNRFILAWRVLRGIVGHAPASCDGCRHRDYLLAEFRRLLDQEREDRRVLVEALRPGTAARLAPARPLPDDREEELVEADGTGPLV